MPFSDPANKPWTIEKIKEINPSTILDCGAGAGIYSDLVRKNLSQEIIIDAIEIWQPYIDEYGLENKYDNLYKIDLREVNNFSYDLVIFGDVLEHMSEDEALLVWDKVSRQSKYAIISIPIIHYHQDAVGGNPYEIHVEEDWNTERILKSFHSIKEYKEFDVTGVFIAEFKNEIYS